MVRGAVLLGAGHAHLFTLKRTGAFVRRGFELVLVAPESFWYSGLATGVLAGIYPRHSTRSTWVPWWPRAAAGSSAPGRPPSTWPPGRFPSTRGQRCPMT